MKNIYYDYWIERLIRLRHMHMKQWLTHSRLEIQYRLELTKQYQQEPFFFTSSLEGAMLIQRQADRIIKLAKVKQRRREVLRKRQAEETYNLLRLKLGATNPLVAFAPYNDQ